MNEVKPKQRVTFPIRDLGSTNVDKHVLVGILACNYRLAQIFVADCSHAVVLTHFSRAAKSLVIYFHSGYASEWFICEELGLSADIHFAFLSDQPV